MKKIFRTSRGSEYFLNSDRSWTRLRYDGQRFDGYFYFGSVDASQNPTFLEDGNRYFSDEFRRQFESVDVPGSEPNFVVGKRPFGFGDCQSGFVVYQKGQLIIREGLKGRIHVGDEIVRVHHEELSRNKNWLRPEFQNMIDAP